MLFRKADAAWKVADFGLTMAGTSKHAQTTAHSRGTPGYRAPELVSPYTKSTFTNKVDIWAFGCILVELIFGVKAFCDDFKVHQYYLEHKFFKRRFDIPETEGFEGRVTRTLLSETIYAVLETDPSNRPAAKDLLPIFERLANLNETTQASDPDVAGDALLIVGRSIVMNQLTCEMKIKQRSMIRGR